MNKYLKICLLIILISAPLTAVFAHESCQDFDFMEGLRSRNIHHRIFSKNELILRKNSNIEHIIKMIEENPAMSTDEDTTKYFAILLLGEYRAAEAIKVLSDNILFKVNLLKQPGFSDDQKTVYAAALALRKIGADVVPYMISNIITSDSKDKRELSTWVILQVLSDLNLSNIPSKKISVYEVQQYVACDTLDLLIEVQKNKFRDKETLGRLSEAQQYCERYKKSTGRVKKAIGGN
ncbi:MAG: HEAT repeat domain-containing protein [Candidatus Dadabacteria bacterium]|nr:HEAT repeat domain-containing protein [Candidatus Dadabacteria bacterium]NIS08448.1 HEAT repeat domain-containing protein [Candidatus Dadabacteria bacterium]NIY21936.1 hypothetical protein [Candidatus Dadabacteria bacterium]